MLKNILDLEGVVQLSKKNLVSVIAGGTCVCGFPDGDKISYSGIDYPELIGASGSECGAFCDARRAEWRATLKKSND